MTTTGGVPSRLLVFTAERRRNAALCSLDLQEGAAPPRRPNASLEEVMTRRRGCRPHPLGASLLVALAVLVTGPLPTTRAQPVPLEGLDEQVEAALVEHDVPGLALAVVKGDSVLYTQGYGVREAGTPGRVDGRTLFASASVTKAFTAALLGTLVTNEKLTWDDRVSEHLPAFRLHDPWVSRQLTVRDLLTHRVGLERGDFLWYSGAYGRPEILRRARHLAPSWGFRERFGYQNLMYVAAGELAARAAGTSWRRLLEARLLDPLRMASTVPSASEIPAGGNVATPHVVGDGRARPVPRQVSQAAAPALGINSSARELARWVRLQLNRGVLEGDTILDPAVVEEMQRPQTVIRKEGPFRLLFAPARYLSYGLGWFLMDYAGELVVHHGGRVDGMTASVLLVPGRDLGLVLLANRGDAYPVLYALAYWIFDRYLGRPATDWFDALTRRMEAVEKRAEVDRQRREQSRIEGTRPSEPLDRYAGRYVDGYLGEVRIRAGAEGLALEYGHIVADLSHWHYDTFRAVYRNPAVGDPELVTFHLDPRTAEPSVVVWRDREFQRRERPSRSDPGSD